jgi:penicillin-binding protein 1C
MKNNTTCCRIALIHLIPILVVGAILAHTGAALAFPTYEEVRAGYRSSESQLLDRNGIVLHELRTDLGVRRLAWTPLQDTSPALCEAVVRAEDKRFFEHAGVDWRALAAAGLRGIASGSFRGASTISMQLAAQLDRELQAGQVRRSLGQKWRQIQAARRIETTWDKKEILEAYLNLVYFRREYQGVGAACRGLFGKAPHGLTAAESLALAALIRSPNASSDQVADRAVRLQRALGWPLREEEVRQTVRQSLQRAHVIPPQADLAPHVARRLAAGRRLEPVVSCTLDAGLQRLARERLAHHLEILQPRNVGEGAILVVENRSGEVLAYVSHTNAPPRSRYVDGVWAKRQAGSVLKPFLYALAFDRRILTPASVLDDTPLDISVPSGIYQPRNYHGGYQGAVTARAALASSMNIPAVRTAEMTGVEEFLRVLRDLGFKGLAEDGDFYGPSLALGTADVNLWELVAAYRALANGGVAGGIRLTAAGPGPAAVPRVFSEEAAFLVSDILADREARSMTFGLENALSSRFRAAVKTGTSKDMRDNWCVGYSRHYTVGAWVGNFSGEPMREVSGVTGAAPLWLEVMNSLPAEDPGEAAAPPAGLVRCSAGAGPEQRQEWFIRGTEPEALRAEGAAAGVRITYPPAGAVFALDPDLPRERQRIFFSVQGARDGLRWMLNGRDLGLAHVPTPWEPAAGRYLLALRDAGATLDSVRFQVRGPRTSEDE